MSNCGVDTAKIAYADKGQQSGVYDNCKPQPTGYYPFSKPAAITPDDVADCDRRKRLGVTVGDKPKCITFHNLGDTTLVLEQLFGAKGCENRKPVNKTIDADNCQVILMKPGRYEFNTEDFGLFPEDFDFSERKLTVDQVQTIIMAGNNGCVSVS